LLKIKFFNRIRRSFRLNIIIRDDKIILSRNINGDYYPSKAEPKGFRLPQTGDSLLMNDTAYLITNIIHTVGDIEIGVVSQAAFISDFSSVVYFIDGTYGGSPIAAGTQWFDESINTMYTSISTT
jgi:hypothetical protein